MQTFSPRTRIIALISILFLTSLACSLLPSQEIPARPEDPPTQITQPTATASTAEPTADPGDATIHPEETAGPTPTQQTAENQQMQAPPPEAGACANPFYPMVPGYQWVYEVETSSDTTQIGMTVTDVQDDQATLNALYLDSGITSEMTVECSDGEILNFPSILLGFLFGDIGGNIEIDHVDGIYAPAYPYLVDHLADGEWSGEYLTSGEISAEVDGDAFVGTLNDSPLTMDWEITPEGDDAYETIEVAAGSYENAIRVTREAELDFDASLTEDGVTTELAAVLDLTTVNWYVPNLGLVKQEVEEADIRIFGVSFPIYITGDIELVEFSTTE